VNHPERVKPAARPASVLDLRRLLGPPGPRPPTIIAARRFGRQRSATLRLALINAALVALPVLFVLVEAAGRRSP
jgi:hypothetical protein